MRRPRTSRTKKFEQTENLTENGEMRTGAKMTTKTGLAMKITFASFTFISAAAFAKIPPSDLTGLSISYHAPTAKACMKNQVPQASSQAIMDRYNMKIDGPVSEPLKQAMATVASKFVALGKPEIVQGMVVKNYPGGRNGKCTNFTDGEKLISMVTVCGSGNHKRNVLASDISLSLIHEFFHAAGQQKYYESYQGSVPTCRVTGYCTHNGNENKRNEEFAEVGAMFVHSPDVLKSKCPEAYNFMAKNVFGGKTPTGASMCQGVPSTAIAGGAFAEPPASTASFAGGADSTASGYNGGSGTQIAGLGEALMGALSMLGQKQEEEQPTGQTVIPRNPADVQSTHPTTNGLPNGTVR